MPVNKSVNTALSLIENDNSKILGLKVGKHHVEPGQYIPKAGMYCFIALSLLLRSIMVDCDNDSD